MVFATLASLFAVGIYISIPRECSFFAPSLSNDEARQVKIAETQARVHFFHSVKDVVVAQLSLSFYFANCNLSFYGEHPSLCKRKST